MLKLLTLPFIAILVACFAFETPASAVQTVPYSINFQGRLTDSAGTPMADGTYNIIFRIYNSANTAVWTESHLVSASQGVTVAGGLFTIQLGAITPLSPSLFNSATANQSGMSLEVELPAPATATTTSPSWTEGAMTPRNQLNTSAYAFNSDTLDGLDSTAFAAASGSANYIQSQSSSAQATSSYWISGTARADTAVVTSAIRPIADSTTALQIQNASGATTLWTADTTNMHVVVGSTANGVTLSTSGLMYTGTARPTASVRLHPEYSGATFTGDGTNNNGSLTSDFCSGTSRLSINTAFCGATDSYNYYRWTTTQATVQDYDLYVRYKMPSDYDQGSMANLQIDGWGTTGTTEQVVLSMYTDNQQAACATLTNAAGTAGAWDFASLASPLGTCTIFAESTVTFKIHLEAGQNNNALASSIGFDYRKKF